MPATARRCRVAAATLVTCLALACLPSVALAQAGGCPFLAVAGTIGMVSRSYDITSEKEEAWRPPKYSDKVSTCTKAQYMEIANALVKEMNDTGFNTADLLRIGFHSCGTWSAISRDAGCNGGWLKYPADRHHGHNTGLPPVLDVLELFHKRYPCITYSDLLTFGAAVGVEESGGPPIAWYPGRRDALGTGPSQPAYSSRLPEGTYEASGVLHYYTQLGLTVREAVAITGGGHSIGEGKPNASGYNGSFTSSGDRWPPVVNQYFVDMVKYAWEPVKVERGDRFARRVQYQMKPGQPGAPATDATGLNVMRFPSDMALRTSRVFSEWTLHYARNADAFVVDFQRVMQRVLHLGSGKEWQPQSENMWSGFKGDWWGFGEFIGPQLDTDGAPALNSIELTAAMDVLADQLADPGVAFSGSLEPVAPAPPAPPTEIVLPTRPPGPPIAAGTVTQFDYPKVGDYHLDWCLDWGADCGMPAALNYCKYLGYDDLAPQVIQGGVTVEPFGEVALNSPTGMTRLLSGANKICVTNAGVTCQTFTFIKCRKA